MEYFLKIRAKIIAAKAKIAFIWSFILIVIYWRKSEIAAYKSEWITEPLRAFFIADSQGREISFLSSLFAEYLFWQALPFLIWYLLKWLEIINDSQSPQ